jgi:hypothetical protein
MALEARSQPEISLARAERILLSAAFDFALDFVR